MIRGMYGISVPSLGFASSQNGKMSLPVEPSSIIYSHFEHVSGIPAQKGIHGLSITKLNLLDVLIGRLNQARRASSNPVNPFEGIDSAIESYRAQIQQAKIASAAMPYIPAPNTQPGALFSLIS